MSIFDKLTNKHSLNKTLRFELIPVPETEKYIKDNNILNVEEERHQKYLKIKPILDDFHNKFITKALENSSINWESYFPVYSRFLENRKNKQKDESKEKDRIEIKLRNQIVDLFNDIANKYKDDVNNKLGNKMLKEFGINVLTEANILKVIALSYQNDKEKLEILKSFNKFYGFLDGYNTNRENYYSNEEKSTAVANRIVNENLPIYAQNKYATEKLPSQIKAVTNNIPDFDQCLTQKEIEDYNDIIGKINTAINGINQIEKRTKKDKIPPLKTLRKQIGCKPIKEGKPRIEELQNNAEFYKFIKEWVQELDKKSNYRENINKLIKYLKTEKHTQNNIYVAKNSFSRLILSYVFDGGYEGAINTLDKSNLLTKKKETGEAELKRPAFSVSELNLAFSNIPENRFRVENIDKDTDWISKAIKESADNRFVNLFCKNMEYLNQKLDVSMDKINVLENNYLETSNKEDNKEVVKTFADSVLDIHRLIGIFRIPPQKVGAIDSEFYNTLNEVCDNFKFARKYDVARNFVTKKPFSTDKIPVSLENGHLLGGFDIGKLREHGGLLLESSNNYYLAICPDKSGDVLKNVYSEFENKSTFFVYKIRQVANSYRMIPKVIFSKKSITKGLWEIPKEITSIKEKETFKIKNDRYNREHLDKLINFYISCIEKYPGWEIFKLHFKNTTDYRDISEFYKDFDDQAYVIEKICTNDSYFKEQVVLGKILLFRILTKDLAKTDPRRNKKENLHTLYFRSLFTNTSAPNNKISGNAQIFFRSSSLNTKENVITKKNKIIITRKGACVNKRYTRDRYFLHLPIEINYKAENVNIKDMNYITRENLIGSGNNFNILGIDRGERNLIYYCLINPKGGIIKNNSTDINYQYKCGDLNYQYKDLINDVAGERKKQRKNWQEISRIKNLKDGYISKVVSDISKMVLEYNAIIVLEDLNYKFKEGRKKIESSVYQKFELALAKKLSYLVIKGTENGNPGSVENAYQLVPPISTFGDIKGKQWGLLFYTNPKYTSKICPVCGFRPYKKFVYESQEKFNAFIKDTINKFVYKGGSFVIQITIEDKTWEIDTKNMERIRFFKDAQEKERKINDSSQKTLGPTKSGFYQMFVLTECFKQLFHGSIDISVDIVSQLTEKRFDKKFYESFVFYFNLFFQIRNGATTDKEEIDYISCPKCQFDTRNNRHNLKSIMNGDANGAYNIARKGLMMVERIIKNN